MRFRFTFLPSKSLILLLTTMLSVGVFSVSLAVAQDEQEQLKEPEFNSEESPEKYLLRFHFVPNQKVSYQIHHENTRTLRKGKVQEITYDKSEALKHFTVQSVDEAGTAKLQSMIDQVKLTARFNNQGEPIVYDSTVEGNPPRVFKKVKETIGIPLAITTFSTQGSVLKTKNLIPNANSDAKQTSNEEKNEDNSNNPAQNFLLEFPEKAISIDDRWSYTYQVHNLRVDRVLTKSAKLKQEYRLKAVEGDIATITFRTTILSLIRDPKVLTQLLEKTPTGTIKFDMKRGIILSRTSKLDNTEFGFSGADSSMRAVSSRTETLTGVELVAAKPEDSQKIIPVKAEKYVEASDE